MPSDIAAYSGRPTPIDYINYARLMNGECPTCHTIKAADGSPRCKCLRDLSPMGGGPNPWPK